MASAGVRKAVARWAWREAQTPTPFQRENRSRGRFWQKAFIGLVLVEHWSNIGLTSFRAFFDVHGRFRVFYACAHRVNGRSRRVGSRAQGPTCNGKSWERAHGCTCCSSDKVERLRGEVGHTACAPTSTANKRRARATASDPVQVQGAAYTGELSAAHRDGPTSQDRHTRETPNSLVFGACAGSVRTRPLLSNPTVRTRNAQRDPRTGDSDALSRRTGRPIIGDYDIRPARVLVPA